MPNAIEPPRTRGWRLLLGAGLVIALLLLWTVDSAPKRVPGTVVPAQAVGQLSGAASGSQEPEMDLHAPAASVPAVSAPDVELLLPDAPTHEPRRQAPDETSNSHFFVHVLDRGREPIENATVYREQTSRESIREIARTGSKGRARLSREHFPRRGQSLFAVAPDGTPTRSAYGGTNAPWPGPVELEIPELPAEPGAFGRVTRAGDGSPMGGVGLTLWPEPTVGPRGEHLGPFGKPFESIETDADGRFQLPFLALHSSIETLTATASGYAPTVVEWDDVVEAQESQSPLKLALHPPKIRRGIVRFTDGAPAAGVTVGVRPAHAPLQWLMSTRTDERGQFELATPPGRIQLEAYLHAYASESEKTDSDDEPIEIEIPYDSTTRVLLNTPARLDREGLSLFVQDDFGLTEYALTSGGVHVYVLIESRARLMLAKSGSWPYRSFVAVALADDVLLKGEVTQTVELRDPIVGSLQIEIDAELRARLGRPTQVDLLALDPESPPYTHAVPIDGAILHLDGIPVGKISVAVSFARSLELAIETVEVRAGETLTVNLGR